MRSLAKAKAVHGNNLLWWSASDSLISGLPDINVLYYGRFAALELKASDGVVRKIQAGWLVEMHKAGAPTYVLRAHPDGPLQASYSSPDGTTGIVPEDWLERLIRNV